MEKWSNGRMELWVIFMNYEFRNSGVANYEKFLNSITPSS
jgi:hypothetical protein